LSRIARFCGATKGRFPWNVAQHSLLVEARLPLDADIKTRLHALLHDAHEAYFGNILQPVKTMLRDDESKISAALTHAASGIFKLNGVDIVARMKNRFDEAISASTGMRFLEQRIVKAVKLADDQALHLEKDLLIAPPQFAWLTLPDPPQHAPTVLVPVEPLEAEAMFMARFSELAALHGR
jgi:hypothetical protein